ncbi:MAG: YeeE/YedE family protein [SAR324 cluster bacterium]|nr:YeeE/YedE family protein [SAR324 cluster bacterium]MBL7034846.1 YeeE/YedE family protein [SAR324 cluster bacterium]
MDIAPLAKMGLISADVNMILAGVLGFAFGLILERAGFGSAHRLVMQWFGRDWSVFRVMFSAIVTAVFGILTLDAFDLMSLDAVYINKTYWNSQIAGGLVMGAGFAIGGYCPGTSFVGLASGKIDALFYIIGMSFGVLVFAEVWPLIEGFMSLGSAGRLTLAGLFGVNVWIVAFVVLLIAIVGFWGANTLEQKINAKT